MSAEIEVELPTAKPEEEEPSGDLNGTNGSHHNISATGMPEMPARPAYQLPAETEEYLQKVEAELTSMGESNPLVRALAERELARVKSGEISEQGYVIVHKDFPIKVVKKIFIPTNEFPKINFVGRVLGPKGSTLKNMQASTRSRIMIFGRGSMWDKNKNSGRGSEEYKAKEEEARNSGDPKYAHLNEDLHIYAEITAYPVEAQARFAHLLTELKKYLDPNHPHHSAGGAEGGMPPGGRPPLGPLGPRPAWGGYPRGPRPPMAPPRGYPVPPKQRPPGPPPSTGSSTGYYATPTTVDPSYSAGAPGTPTYGYAAYPSTDYSSSSSTGYDNQAAQAQQYAAQRQQQASQGALQGSQGAAQGVYGQPPPAVGGVSVGGAYVQSGPYVAAAAPTAYTAGAGVWDAYATGPAAKKPRTSAPYGGAGAY